MTEYVAKEKLVQLFKEMESEELGARVRSGSLTKEANKLALAELASRGYELYADADNGGEKSETAGRRSKRAAAGIAFVLCVMVTGGIGYVYLRANSSTAGEPASLSSEVKDEPLVIAGLELRSTEATPFSGDLAEYAKQIGIGAPEKGASPWRAFYWRDGSVEVEPVTELVAENVPFDWQHPEHELSLAKPRVSEQPLFIFRERFAGQDERRFGPEYPVGSIPGVRIDTAFHDNWRHQFELQGRGYTLEATSLKGKDGKEIPGALQLEMVASGGGRSVILSRTPGHLFAEQRVLWAGYLSGTQVPAFYIRRTLVTGEVDHILSVASAEGEYRVAGKTVDPDEPTSSFTSGVGELEENEVREANLPGKYPDVIIPVTTINAPPRTFATSGLSPVERMSIYEIPEPTDDGEAERGVQSIPQLGVLREVKFLFKEVAYRVIVELVETYSGDGDRQTYRSALPFGSYEGGGRSLVVSLQRGDKRQVLLVTSPQLDSGITFSAGDFDGSGELSVDIDYYPHYNNGMYLGWRAADDGERLMRRSSVYQSQGC